MSELGNLGTAGTGFDLPAAGTALAQIKEFPGFVPGDFAYVYRGDIDPTLAGLPYSYERLVTDHTIYYPDAVATTIVNSGSEGTTGDITSESSVITLNQRHMSFPGVSTNYLSTPDAAALDITASIEITLRVAASEWDNRIGNQRLVAKSGTARGYEFFIGFDTNHGFLGFTRDGTTIAYSTRRVPFYGDHTYWIRVTYNSGTGTTKFYYADDSVTEPASWTQLGADVTTVTGAIVANAETLKIGTFNGTGDMFKGRIYNVIIRNADTAGAVVLNIDMPTDTAAMTQDVTTTFTATSGQTITLTKSGTPPATVRVILADVALYASGHRWAYASGNIPSLEILPNDLHVAWVRVTHNNSVTTTRREIFPLMGVNAPFQDNSWGLYLDTFHSEVKVTFRTASGSHGFESMAQQIGISTTTAPLSTGTSVFGAAIMEHAGNSKMWLFRYTDAGLFVYDTTGGTTGALTHGVTGTDLIGSTNDLWLWQGMTGFTLESAGYFVLPDVAADDQDVRFDLSSFSADIYMEEIVEPYLRAVALDLTEEYAVGEFWRANADGTMEVASEAVEEGDIFAVTSTTPTFQQIKLDHPSRRKTLFRPQNVTFGPPSSPIHVPAADDFFVWVVVAGWDFATDYFTYAYDSVEDGFMMIEAGRDPDLGNLWLYMEIDDNASDFGYAELDGSDVGETRTIWQYGASQPTLFAMAVDRQAAKWTGWLYDHVNGLITLETEETTPVTWAADIDLDSVWFFGPEENEGYMDTVWWGGGWNIGPGVIPDDTGLVRLWEQAVYGYSNL